MKSTCKIMGLGCLFGGNSMEAPIELNKMEMNVVSFIDISERENLDLKGSNEVTFEESEGQVAVDQDYFKLFNDHWGILTPYRVGKDIPRVVKTISVKNLESDTIIWTPNTEIKTRLQILRNVIDLFGVVSNQVIVDEKEIERVKSVCNKHLGQATEETVFATFCTDLVTEIGENTPLCKIFRALQQGFVMRASRHIQEIIEKQFPEVGILKDVRGTQGWVIETYITNTEVIIVHRKMHQTNFSESQKHWGYKYALSLFFDKATGSFQRVKLSIIQLHLTEDLNEQIKQSVIETFHDGDLNIYDQKLS